MKTMKLWIARNEGWEEEYLHDRYQHVLFEIIKFKDLSQIQELPIGIRRGEFLSIILRNKSISRTKIFQRTKTGLFDLMYIMDQERGILDSIFRRGGDKDVRIFFIVSERALYDSGFSGSKRLTRSHAINSLFNCNNIFWIDPIIYNPERYITVRRRIMIPSKLIPGFLKSVV